ncbi:MAG: alpha-amylase family glycosyl hydrolase [Roseburia sp.]|nr:alpha-amylase family glycosyl hydrolase [Roseburia sp.]
MRGKKNKRILRRGLPRMSACVLAVALALNICACGSGSADAPEGAGTAADEQNGAQVQGNAGTEAAESGTEASGEAADGAQAVSEPPAYAYEQELNVIEDNYRNYYEIFVYSFYDSDGDGIGDLNGVTEKLDYVQDMGFNGIWLMPIMQSATYHKYDVTDYCSVDREYGTVEDFERLVEECHKRDIRLIIDFVINHTSSSHPWFTDACAYLRQLPKDAEPDLTECPYVDYYHFSREQVNGDYYAVSGSDWYYEGVFWSEMPDLNLSSEALRAEIEAAADFWIAMGVDGFRMDAAMHFEEGDTTFNNEALNWLYSYCRGQNEAFYMVSEVWAAKATIANYYESGTPSMFNFDVADVEGKLIKAARGTYKIATFVQNMADYAQDYGSKNEAFIDAPFIANHDMGRVANDLQKDADDMKMACGLLMMMNGSPFVYYGEEIGMSSSGQKDENKRLAMIWSDTDTTGMTNGPKDADQDIQSAFAGVEQQLEDYTSILNYYKRAVRLRNENPEIARGEIAIVESLTEGNQAAITKTYDGSIIGIVYNTSDEEAQVSLSGTALDGMGIRGYLTLNGEEIVLEEGTLRMPAQSICILKAAE